MRVYVLMAQHSVLGPFDGPVSNTRQVEDSRVRHVNGASNQNEANGRVNTPQDFRHQTEPTKAQANDDAWDAHENALPRIGQNVRISLFDDDGNDGAHNAKQITQTSKELWPNALAHAFFGRLAVNVLGLLRSHLLHRILLQPGRIGRIVILAALARRVATLIRVSGRRSYASCVDATWRVGVEIPRLESWVLLILRWRTTEAHDSTQNAS